MLFRRLRFSDTGRILWVVAIVALALAFPSGASATVPCQRVCSCLHYVRDVPFSGYQFGVRTPTNARYFVALPEDESHQIVLYAESDPGATFPVTIEAVAGTRAAWVTPESELAPNADYIIEIDWDAAAETEVYRYRINTDAGPSNAAPEPFEPAVAPLPDGESCDPFLGFTLRGTAASEEQNDLLRILIETPGEPDHLLFMRSDGWSAIVLGTDEGSDGVCAEAARYAEPALVPSLPSTAPGQTVKVTITRFDAAGKESAPTVLSDVEIEEAAAGDPDEMYGACCGCRAAGVDPEPASLSLPFAALALLLFGRRWPRRTLR